MEQYEPDLQDILTGEALALGGTAFLEQVAHEATAYCDGEYPWDGIGDEPPERVSAWLAYMWQAVEVRRFEKAAP
ncbi:hypothetical protein ACFQH9_02095 [Pseudonocardia lutea]|uniref:Uncharacterized protein n=1 Tax=Pseudonocardia lutea TaxID=2172015 RepID=A0ABW1I2A3_9PSEU